MLRNALKSSHDPIVCLYAVRDAVLVKTPHGNVALKLLEFGRDVKIAGSATEPDLFSYNRQK